jgi:hypothetical protein
MPFLKCYEKSLANPKLYEGVSTLKITLSKVPPVTFPGLS